MNVTSLVQFIHQTHTVLQKQAGKVITRPFTIRKPLMGYNIEEYQQNWENGTRYGTQLVVKLAKKINQPGLSSGNPHFFRLRNKTYSHTGRTTSARLKDVKYSAPLPSHDTAPHVNPQVGILLVTNKNEGLVEQATEGMENKLFVSKCLVQLLTRKEFQQFIQSELKLL